MKTSLWQTLINHKEIICIVILATLLRTWNLNTEMIFFGDAARDLLVAVSSVQTHQLPLLGIPSSVPRFHQGPVTIWMEMLVYLFFGHRLLAFGFFFAFLSILAVIFLFEVLTVFANRTTALIAAFLLSVFPLAVANGRTPYHTTPIPFFLVMYLFGLMQLWQRKKYGVFWAVFSFCLLFQFELATLPLSLLIFYTLWRQHHFDLKTVAHFQWRKHRQYLFQAGAAVGIGLWPQVLYDLTHHFEHLGGFAVWVIYRIVSFLGYKNQHTFSFAQFLAVFSTFQVYLMRTWAGENKAVFVVFLVLLLFGIGLILHQLKNKQKVSPVIELATVATLIQSLAYLVHGGPSEAYFPPFFILTAIILGYTFSELIQLQKQQKHLAAILVTVFLIAYGSLNILQIWQHHFFVDTHYAFNYGYGVEEQRQIVALIITQTNGDVSLHTTQAAGSFPTYFDNLRWLLADKGITEDAKNGQVVFIEPATSEFPKIVSYLKVPFPSVDLYFLDKNL